MLVWIIGFSLLSSIGAAPAASMLQLSLLLAGRCDIRTQGRASFPHPWRQDGAPGKVPSIGA
jgi:hypothetical protein